MTPLAGGAVEWLIIVVTGPLAVGSLIAIVVFLWEELWDGPI